MLEYRPLDFGNEINEVVELIQKNLQPKYTRDFFIWKHLNNPFGPSFSVVATYNKKIVGVVFYMRYNFYNEKGEMIKCIRPLDVCTAFEMRGKGVFKKLMTACLDFYNDDYQLIMATPNLKSFPELIKLGWKVAEDKYTYKFSFMISSNLEDGEELIDILPIENSSKILLTGDFFQVGNSLGFIHWRYKDPIYRKVKFEAKEGKILYIIYRIDLIKGIKSVILCDSYGDINIMQKALKRILAREKTNFVYFLENLFNKEIRALFSIKHRKALITFKENNYSIPHNLIISLGDLEGKL